MTSTVHAPSRSPKGVSQDDLRAIHDRTAADIWQALRGKQLFITGGTGFVGCWLLEALTSADARFDLRLALNVLTRRPETFLAEKPHLARHRSVHLVKGDMTELESLTGRFDMVIHGATDVASASTDPISAYETIVDGTKQVLNLASRANAQRFLYLSSGAVYGSQPPQLTAFAEDLTYAPGMADPAAAYGHAKRISEWLVHMHAKAHGLAPVIARLFALIGPYLALNAKFAASHFIRDTLAGRPIEVVGDRRVMRSYLYGADMAVWLLALLVKGEAFEAYNVGSEQPTTIGELATLISRWNNGQVRFARPESPSEDLSPPARYLPDTEKARSRLDLEQFTPLESAVSKTIAWFRETHCQL